MSIMCLAAVAAAMFATIQQPSSGTLPASASEDAAVVAAALEHTVVSDIRRLFPDRLKQSIALLERTVAFRRQDEPPDGRRPSTERWRAELEAGMVEGVTVREQLLRSFELRNAVAHPAPDVRLPLVALVPVGQGHGPVGEADGVPLKSEDLTRVWASVTLPGYSTNSRALVYVSYVCGMFCGKGWLVVLQRTSSGWRVGHVTMLWIS